MKMYEHAYGILKMETSNSLRHDSINVKRLIKLLFPLLMYWELVFQTRLKISSSGLLCDTTACNASAIHTI